MASKPAVATASAELPASNSQHGVIRLVNRVRVEVIDALERELAPYDISAPQLIVLASVANREADTPAALCKTISYDPGAMTRMIDRLEQKGLVRRVPSPDDRRATNLEMTVAGKALYPALVQAKERVVGHFLRGFSKDDVKALESLLNRMLANR
jgi:DNA-binding MarR family transcriptional regulator